MGVLGESRVRWALAVLLGCASLLALVLVLVLTLAATPFSAEAQAAGGTGRIEGTVTKAEGGTGIGGIEVCAYAVSGELEGPSGESCAVTSVGGDYAISELPAGEYDVEFAVPPGSPLYYVTQYYNDKSSFAEAETVTIGAGVTAGIDAAMREGGKIAGTVTQFTESEDIVPLGNIEVLAYESGNEMPVGYATTNTNGEYTIAGLAPGSYTVEFSPTPEGGLNFVTQYYNGKTSRAAANEVKVVQGATTGTINAQLRVGGEILGTVTDAWTHAPVAGVYVFALRPGGGFAGVASTNASGEYTIVGLATGSYKIEFIQLAGNSRYILQYYNDQASLASANPVSVHVESATTGVDAALVRKEPIDTVAPTATGTPAVGQTLSCSTGAWTGEPTPTYTYAWLRNGTAIPGAGAGTYTVQAADQGASLACMVTATNKSGGNSAVSNTLSVPVTPPPPTPTPVVKLLSTRILVSGRSARVPISCAQATCTGTIELTERIVLSHRHHGRTWFKRETLVLGTGVYALSADHSATVLVHLTRAGRRALTSARYHRLPILARVSVTDGTAIRGPVVLSEVARRRRRL